MGQLSNFNKKKDSEIWAEVKKGNKKALSFIYEKYANHLFNYGYKFVRNRNLVNDSIQDVFINIWSYKKNISETNSIKNYLFKAFRRELVRKINQENKEGDEFNDNNEEFSISAEQIMIINEEIDFQRNLLTNAISLLPSRQKEVIHLKYVSNLSYAKIAGIMDLEVKSVYKLLYKAIDRLKDLIHEPSSV